MSQSCIRKTDSAQQDTTTIDEGIPLDVGIPLSPEVASALTGLEDDAEVDVYIGDEVVAEGVRGGIRAGVRGGIRASEQSGVRGGVRGGVRASSQGGVRAVAARRQATESASEENTLTYQFTFQLPTAHARDGANNIRSRVRSRKNKEVPFIEVTATVSIKLPPPPPPGETPQADQPVITFEIEDTPIPLNQVVLPDIDGDGVSSLVEVATAKATTGSIDQALAAAADASSTPTQEQVVAAFTQLGKTLEKNLKDAGVTVKVDLQDLDVTPPDTTATLDKVQAKVGDPITVTATCSKSNCVYRCALDDKLQTACPSPFVLNTEALPLPEGPHNLGIRAADPLGNTDQTPVALSFTILPKAECGNKICESGETEVSCPGDCDKVPPDTSITKVESVHGTLLTGVTVTNEDELRISLACTKSACVFECAIAKGGEFAFTVCTSPFALSLSKGDGTYTVKARAKDAHGNVDLTPAEVKIRLVKTPPETAISNQPSAVSNQKSAAFGFSCSNLLDAQDSGLSTSLCSFLCQLDTGTPAACTSPFTATNLADGTHTFTVSAKDALGNADATPAGFSWVVDTAAPTVAINSAPAQFTNNNKPTFTFSSTEPTTTLSGFECHCDSEPFATCTSPVAIVIPFTDGLHTCEVRSRDTAGNTSAAAAASFTVDTVPPPSVNIRDGKPGYSQDHDFQPDVLTLNGWWDTPTDAGSGINFYEVGVGTTNCGGGSQDNLKTFAATTLTNVSASGLSLNTTSTYFINVRMYDKAGNMRCDSSDGIQVTSAANNVLGHRTVTDQPDYATQDPRAPKQANSFNEPGGLAYDSGSTPDRLFVADSLNNRVLVFNADETTKLPLDRTADFVLGQPNFTTATANTQNTGNGCTTAVNACGLSEPRGLVHDAARNYLYVADHLNHRVLGFDVATITNGEAAVEVLGQPNLTSNTQATTSTGMCKPIGLAIRTDTQCATASPPTGTCLFVSEFCNHRITTFSHTGGGVFSPGQAAGTVIGQDDTPPCPATGNSNVFDDACQETSQNGLKFPRGIVYDTNYLYVADSSNNRLLRYNVTGGIVPNGMNADALLGQNAWNGNTPNTTVGGLRDPRGVTVTNTKIFVAEGTAGGIAQGRVTVFSSTIACTAPPTSCPDNAANVLGQADFTTNGGNTSQSGLRNPTEVLAAGNYLYVADSSNHRVLIYDVTAVTDGEPAYDLAGQVDPSGVALWTKNQINNAGPSSLFQPWAAITDTVRHRLFVADAQNNRVLAFNLSTDNTLPDGQADNVIGQPNLGLVSIPNVSPTAATQNQLNLPGALALDQDNGKLFVADSDNNRVVVFDVSGASLTNGANAIAVLGQANFTSVGTACSQAAMNYPIAVLYAAGFLYVSDNFNYRVLVFNVGDGIVNGENAVGVLGGSIFTDCTGSGTPNQTQFNSGGGPCGLAMLDGSSLLVSDANNNRVLVFNLGNGLTNGEAAVNVLGQSSFTTGAAALTQSGLSNPEGLAIDPTTKRLYVADDGNKRVIVHDLNSIANGQNAVGVIGQTNFTSNTSGTSQTLINLTSGDPMTRLSLIGNGALLLADGLNHRILFFPVQ